MEFCIRCNNRLTTNPDGTKECRKHHVFRGDTLIENYPPKPTPIKTRLRYGYIVRCKSCNYIFLAEKDVLKSKIYLHLTQSHDPEITFADLNLRYIHEFGIILSRVSMDIFKVFQEQAKYPDFWKTYRILLKIVKKT